MRNLAWSNAMPPDVVCTGGRNVPGRREMPERGPRTLISPHAPLAPSTANTGTSGPGLANAIDHLARNCPGRQDPVATAPSPDQPPAKMPEEVADA